MKEIATVVCFVGHFQSFELIATFPYEIGERSNTREVGKRENFGSTGHRGENEKREERLNWMQEKERHQTWSQFNRFNSHIVLGVCSSLSDYHESSTGAPPPRTRVHSGNVPLLERIDAIARIILNVPRRL